MIPKWMGPYEITDMKNKLVELRNMKTLTVLANRINIDRLKLYKKCPPSQKVYSESLSFEELAPPAKKLKRISSDSLPKEVGQREDITSKKRRREVHISWLMSIIIDTPSWWALIQLLLSEPDSYNP